MNTQHREYSNIPQGTKFHANPTLQYMGHQVPRDVIFSDTGAQRIAVPQSKLTMD